MTDWLNIVGLLAMGFGSCAILAVGVLLAWVVRQPEKELERRLSGLFLRRRGADRRKLDQLFPYSADKAYWIVRSGTDRRHGGGRRQGH